MAITKYYGNFFKAALNKEIDIDSDTIKVMLCTSSYTPNQDTHGYKNDVTNEVSGATGYTTGGATLGSAAVSYDGATNVLKISGGNIEWADSAITARYAVIYDDTPATDATKPLIAYIDFESDKSSNAAAFKINWSEDGAAKVTIA
jgi:hypothetical protein